VAAQQNNKGNTSSKLPSGGIAGIAVGVAVVVAVVAAVAYRTARGKGRKKAIKKVMRTKIYEREQSAPILPTVTKNAFSMTNIANRLTGRFKAVPEMVNVPSHS
jgi:hypothetical protein